MTVQHGHFYRSGDSGIVPGAAEDVISGPVDQAGFYGVLVDVVDLDAREPVGKDFLCVVVVLPKLMPRLFLLPIPALFKLRNQPLPPAFSRLAQHPDQGAAGVLLKIADDVAQITLPGPNHQV